MTEAEKFVPIRKLAELRACLDAFEEVTPYLSAAGNTGAGSYIRTGISSTEGAAIAGV